MSESYDLDSPDRVTVGTVGPVGERLFVLQVREGRRLVTMKLEKIQLSALCRRLGRLLRELPRPHELPGAAALELEPFDEPDFVVRYLVLTYDEVADRIVLLADEIDRTETPVGIEGLEESADVDGSTARMSMSREQAAAVAIRGTELVEAGRPPCPLCGHPLDPRGHACPRTNGNQPPLT
jgi:uncharacterized repeat protein (TIGR03847 family)